MNPSSFPVAPHFGPLSVDNELVGMNLPPLSLPSTDGQEVDLTMLPSRCVLILHLLALGREQVPPAAWTQIPGAAGCSEQLLGFKFLYGEFQAKKMALFGVSTQSSLVQKAVVEELGLPFPLLSDVDYKFGRSLHLPMRHLGRRYRLPRVILGVRDGYIEEAVYPVVSPANSAAEVLRAWSKKPHPGARQ